MERPQPAGSTQRIVNVVSGFVVMRSTPFATPGIEHGAPSATSFCTGVTLRAWQTLRAGRAPRT